MRGLRNALVLALVFAGARSANAQCYVFSGGGAQLRINISFINLVTGPFNVMGYKTSTINFSGANIFTVGGTQRTSDSIQSGAANIQYFPAPTFGPQGLTTFVISVPDDSPPGTKGGRSWTANLFGAGDLIPNGLLPNVLPPALLWKDPDNSNYIEVLAGSTRTKYPIDRVSGCSPVGGKGLGNASEAPGGCVCGDPITIHSGNLFEQVVDYQTFTPNRLQLVRFYNSMASPESLAKGLGANWRTNFDRYLRLESPTSVTAERPDGREVSFSLSGNVWTTDSDIDLRLTSSGTTWTLTDQDDAVETYTATSTGQGLLQSIVARGGYRQTLQYDSSNQLLSVTDSYNRQLRFVVLLGKLLSVVTPDGLTFTYTFDASNRLSTVNYSTAPATRQQYLYENGSFPNALTGIVDENGNRFATWGYDSAGRAISNEHAGGADRFTVSYNDSDGSRTITSPLGAQTVYKFTTLQNSLKITEMARLATATTAAAVTTITYDSNGYPATQKDWNGNTTVMVNNVHGQPLSITRAAGTSQARTTTIVYHPTLHLPAQVTEPGLVSVFTYDSTGNLLSLVRTDTTTNSTPYSTTGATRSWTFTWSNSLPATAKGSRTDVNDLTKFNYDASGTLTSITNALNQVINVTQHAPNGLPQTVVDANGVTTANSYDPRFRLLTSTVTTAAGALSVKYSYDAAGDVTGLTLPDNSALAFTLDAAHRVTGVTDSLQNRASYGLDALGNRVSSTLANSSGTTILRQTQTFDALGRPIRTTGGLGQVSTYRYDSNGNPIGVIDPLQHETQRVADALDRIVRTTDAAGGTIATTYDAHDRVLSFTDANRQTTSYIYNGFGDRIQESSPARGTTVYRYDSAGNVVQRTDARGAVTNYTYDVLNRMLTTEYPAHPAENVSLTYDQPGHGFGIGRLTSVADAAGTLSRSYDERGNIVRETRVRGSVSLTTSYTFDSANRVLSITYPSGAIASYARDALGRVSSVSVTRAGRTTAVVSGVTYQPFGQAKSLTFGNGIAETRSFDLSGKVTALTHTGVQDLNYTYDEADNVLSIADGVTQRNNQAFRYDFLNRLVQASGAYGSIAYSYDANGNRLTETLPGSAVAALDGLGAVTEFLYNDAGRLVTTRSGNRTLAEYTYDAFGRRLARLGASTALNLFVYSFDGMLLEQTDAQGNAQSDYIYLNGQPCATIAADGNVFFLHDDRLGAPQLATDQAKKVVWSGDYQPFGMLNAATSQTAALAQSLRLPGQEFELDSGFYQNGFRDYAPGLGRYLESDPLGLFGGRNTYAYANSNPLRFTDPLGLCDLLDWVTDWAKDWAKSHFEDVQEKVEEDLGISTKSLATQLLRAESGSAMAQSIEFLAKMSGAKDAATKAFVFGYAATSVALATGKELYRDAYPEDAAFWIPRNEYEFQLAVLAPQLDYYAEHKYDPIPVLTWPGMPVMGPPAPPAPDSFLGLNCAAGVCTPPPLK